MKKTILTTLLALVALTAAITRSRSSYSGSAGQAYPCGQRIKGFAKGQFAKKNV